MPKHDLNMSRLIFLYVTFPIFLPDFLCESTTVIISTGAKMRDHDNFAYFLTFVLETFESGTKQNIVNGHV